MKKILSITVLTLLLSIFCINISTQAQTFANKWVLSGSIGYTNQNQTSSSIFKYFNNRTFTFSPAMGYFINNTWQIGIRSTLSNTHTENKYYNGTIDHSNSLHQVVGLGGYVRNYSWMFNHFAFYLEGEVRYAYNTTHTRHYYTEQMQESRYRGGIAGIYLKPGFTWQVNQRIGIDFTTNLFDLSYSYQKSKSDDENSFTKKQEGFQAIISNGNKLLQNIQIGISVFM